MNIAISNCPETGKLRKITNAMVVLEYDGNFRIHRLVNYFEPDGVTLSETTTLGISRDMYKQREQQGTTRDSWLDPQTNIFVDPGTEGAVLELDHLMNRPLNELPAEVTTVKELIEYMIAVSTTIADQNNKF